MEILRTICSITFSPGKPLKYAALKICGPENMDGPHAEEYGLANPEKSCLANAEKYTRWGAALHAVPLGLWLFLHWPRHCISIKVSWVLERWVLNPMYEFN